MRGAHPQVALEPSEIYSSFVTLYSGRVRGIIVYAIRHERSWAEASLKLGSTVEVLIDLLKQKPKLSPQKTHSCVMSV